VVMKVVYSADGSRRDRADPGRPYMHRGFKARRRGVLRTDAVINELFSPRRTPCEEYET